MDLSRSFIENKVYIFDKIHFSYITILSPQK